MTKSILKITYFLLFLAAIGICAGAFFETSMKGDEKLNLANNLFIYLQNTTSSTIDTNQTNILLVFIHIIKRNILYYLIAILSPILLITLPLLPIYLFAKGLSFGFSSAMILELYSYSGIGYIIKSLLPYYLLQLPIMTFLFSVSCYFGYQMIHKIIRPKQSKLCKNKKALYTFTRQYLIIYGIGFLLLLLTYLLEAFLLVKAG